MKQRYRSLTDYLEQTGTTNQSLAEQVGVTPQYISMLKNGRRRADPEIALRIHELTGVRLQSLVSDHVLAICEALS